MVGNRQHIIHGLRDGIPIAMGYFAVAFSLGIIAAKAGLTPQEGFLTSFFTRASAGEYGTYTLVAVQAAYVEVVAMGLVANLRYDECGTVAEDCTRHVVVPPHTDGLLCD